MKNIFIVLLNGPKYAKQQKDTFQFASHLVVVLVEGCGRVADGSLIGPLSHSTSKWMALLMPCLFT